MYVNDLLLVDLVEIPRGSVCISRGVIGAYIVFSICRVLQVIFEPRVQELKKKHWKAKLSKTCWKTWNFGKKKKNEEVFPHN